MERRCHDPFHLLLPPLQLTRIQPKPRLETWTRERIPPSAGVQNQESRIKIKLPKRRPLTMSFTSIPILDLALARDPATKPEFLEQLRYALMEVGFLYLKNVGIPNELFQEVVDKGKAFFDIPLEEK